MNEERDDEPRERDDIEFDLLIEGVYRYYGYDFRDYSRASLRRRVNNILRSEKLDNVTQLLERVLHKPGFIQRFVAAISVPSTSMFRDPVFYKAFREKVVPMLRSQPFIRIWHAGCSTGEEVYSLAVLLEEEGLYRRCRIYATDINEFSLAQARNGSYSTRFLEDFTRNYELAGGRRSFSDYHLLLGGQVVLHPRLRENVVFSIHNLVTDASFNEFSVILCRNVMIYFEPALQDNVFRLLYESLEMFGVLAIGLQETMRGHPHASEYEAVDAQTRLYRKTGKRV